VVSLAIYSFDLDISIFRCRWEGHSAVSRGISQRESERQINNLLFGCQLLGAGEESDDTRYAEDHFPCARSLDTQKSMYVSTAPASSANSWKLPATTLNSEHPVLDVFYNAI
jgi:hypothetical protein